MDGGSIIRTACGTARAAGASRTLFLPATSSSKLTHPQPLSAVLPSDSCSKIHPSSTATSTCSTSIPSLRNEDPPLDKEDKEEDVKARAQTGVFYSDLSIFGPEPSKEEAETAVSALKLFSSHFVGDEAISFTSDVFDQTSSPNENMKRATLSNLGQGKPRQLANASKSVLSQAQYKVLNALHLLRINPSVQSMVVSLSSDKAVWNAVMKNERVQELRKSYHAGKYIKYAEQVVRGSAAPCLDDIAAQILSWLFESAKAQVMQFIEDIISLVNKLFHSKGKEENTMEIVSDLVRSSFMVSVMVFIVVVLKRIA